MQLADKVVTDGRRHRLQRYDASLGDIGLKPVSQPVASGTQLAEGHIGDEAEDTERFGQHGNVGALRLVGLDMSCVTGMTQPAQIVVLGERRAHAFHSAGMGPKSSSPSPEYLRCSRAAKA